MVVGRRWLLAPLVALLALLPVGADLLVQAGEPAVKPPAAKADAARLIALLGHQKFEQRKEAKDDLEKLGSSALPQLHEAANKPADPEVRRALDEIITKLETADALKPSRVTLKATDQTLRKVVEEFGRQTGYKIEVWAGAGGGPGAGTDDRDKRLLTLDLKDVTFWEGLQQICEQGSLVVQEGWYGNDNANVRLQAGDAFPGYYCLDGPFRVVARNMNYFRNLELGGQRNMNPDMRRNESLSLTLSISVEPRLPLYAVGQPTITEALDDLDQSLKPSNQQNGGGQRAYYGGGGYRTFTQQVTLGLEPKANGRRVKSLKGTIPVTIIALQRPKITVDLKEWEPPSEVKPKPAPKAAPKSDKDNTPVEPPKRDPRPAKNDDSAAPPAPAAAKATPAAPKSKTFKAGSVTLTIEDISRNGNQATVKLSVSESARGQQDYSWVNTVIQRIEVVDDKGVKLQSFSSSWGMNNNSVQGTFTYGGAGGNGGAPAKLIYYDWITLSHDVPFAFQDLPLP